MVTKLKMGDILNEMSLSDDFKKMILKYKAKIVQHYRDLGLERVDNSVIIDGIREILIKNKEYSGPKMDAVKRLINNQEV